MNRLLKFFIISLLIFITLGFLLNSLHFFAVFIELVATEHSSESIINDILVIDFKLFYKIGFLTLFSTFGLASVANITMMTFLSEDTTAKILFILFKFSLVLSVVIPMLFVLTKEQFNVVTTIVSFLALFSFMIPKNILNKLKENKVKKIRNDNPTENNK